MQMLHGTRNFPSARFALFPLSKPVRSVEGPVEGMAVPWALSVPLVLRTIVLLVLLAIFGRQAYLSIKSYAKGDTVTVASTENADLVRFPSFSLCPMQSDKELSPVYGITNLTEAYSILRETGNFVFSVSQAFHTNPRYYDNAYLGDLLLRGNHTSDLKHEMDELVIMRDHLIRCLVYNPTKESAAGRENSLMVVLNLTKLDTVLTVVHGPELYFSSSLELFGSKLVFLDHPSLHSGPPSLDGEENKVEVRGGIYALQRQRRKRLREKFPCVEPREGSPTLAECYSKYIRDNLNCTLPWDRRQQSKGKEKCESPEHYLAMKSLLRPFETMGERELREETGCLPPCSYFSYDSKRLKQSVFTAEMEAGAAMTKEEAGHLYTAHFHFKETTYEVSKDVLMYDFKALVADFGGYLGLLLGVSAIQAYDAIVKAGTRIMTKGRVVSQEKAHS